MKKASGQKNTHLIVLAAVSALVAMLLFLDALVPVIPDGKERPDRGEEDMDGMDGEETKKHWWQNIFDRDEPADPADPDVGIGFPETEPGEPVPRPKPTLTLYYTEDEMIEWYYDVLAKSLSELEYMEAQGEIPPISLVGLFNVDTYGTPELIVVHESDGETREYRVFELQSLELLTRWSCYGKDDGLAVYEKDGGGYAALFTHSGDGDDLYVCELESTDRLRYMELAAMICDINAVTYRYEGRRTSQEAYEVAIKSINATYDVMEQTTLRLTTWHSDTDKEMLAKIVLTSGQRFLHTDGTEP